MSWPAHTITTVNVLVPVGPGGTVVGPAAVDRIAALDAGAAEYDRPPAHTADAYAADWRVWLRFIDDLNDGLAQQDPGGIPVPPTATNRGTFVAFVLWHEQRGLAPETAKRRLYGVLVTLRNQGIEVPKATTAAARRALNNYRLRLSDAGKRLGRGPAPVATITQIRRICAVLPDTLAGHRDRALVLFGFTVAARRSNLAGLDIADVVEHNEGLVITIRRNKTGPREATVERGTHDGTCPVRAWRTWIEAAELADDDGPLFRPIDRHGNIIRRPLSPRACGEIVSRAGQTAGVSVKLTGHSLRSGLATAARAAGHDVKTIAEQGGWNPNSAELYKYMRIVDRWTDNATKGIGL